MKKKVSIIIIAILALIFIYRIVFSYTLITVPIVTDSYEAGDKQQFDFSIINPIYKKKLHAKYKIYISKELTKQTVLWRENYFKSINNSDFWIKNLRQDNNRIIVLVNHKNETGIVDGYFIYDIVKDEIIESEP